jgi:hypothetical protein
MLYFSASADAIAALFPGSHFYIGAKVKNRILPVLGLIILGLLAGCGSSGPKRDINDPANSLVFGYIDMDEAPTGVASATILQVAPPSETPYWGLAVNKGLFYNTYLPPGSYQMSKFSGSGFIAGQHDYSFSRQGNQTALRITKPGIYFLGSFKYKKMKTGFFEPGAFSIEKVNKPTEAELLKRILDEDEEVRNSAWGNKIRARFAQLK